jgi:hypothetical protein
MRALEVNATINEERELQLDEKLPIPGPSRVRVIILLPDESEQDEREWLQAASQNTAFEFLRDPEEDIYSTADGQPFRDEG